MKRIGAIIIIGLSTFAATTTLAQQAVNLAGVYRCIQGCTGPGAAFVAQNGRQLGLANEAGQQSKAWIDRPGRIWIQSWNEGAAYSSDGMTLQFDHGSVWQRDLQNRPVVVVPRRPVVALPPPAPSAWARLSKFAAARPFAICLVSHATTHSVWETDAPMSDQVKNPEYETSLGVLRVRKGAGRYSSLCFSLLMRCPEDARARSKSGSLAMLAAIRRASSRVSSFAAAGRPTSLAEYEGLLGWSATKSPLRAVVCQTGPYEFATEAGMVSEALREL